MIINKTTREIKKPTDCFNCPYFDKEKKKCIGGIGKNCFEYDPKTKIAIDPITKLPIKI